MLSTDKQPTCDDRIDDEMDRTLATLRNLWESYCKGEDWCDDEETCFHEYGLSFDYVAPGTFTDQDQGYFRYQISWGGPSDEFRFYVNPDLSCYAIEYWFMDWFDGARRSLQGDDKALMMEIYGFFSEIGSVDSAFNEAMED